MIKVRTISGIPLHSRHQRIVLTDYNLLSPAVLN